MHRIAPSFRNLVTSLLISLATTEKSAFYFSDSPLIQQYNAILLHDCFVKEEEE